MPPFINLIFWWVQDLLVPVFENGELLKDITLDEVRERAELPLVLSRRHGKKDVN